VAIFFGAAAGNVIFNIARDVYRSFRPASPREDEEDDEDEKDDEEDENEEDEVSPSAGPYRTSSTADGSSAGVAIEQAFPREIAAKDESRDDWRYRPLTTCPRCGEDGVGARGRFQGSHTYSLMSRTVNQHEVSCSGHEGQPHVHYQCLDCGADWAEIPPEEYDEDDIR